VAADASTGIGHYNTNPGSGIAAHGSRLTVRGFFFRPI